MLFFKDLIGLLEYNSRACYNPCDSLCMFLRQRFLHAVMREQNSLADDKGLHLAAGAKAPLVAAVSSHVGGSDPKKTKRRRRRRRRRKRNGYPLLAARFTLALSDVAERRIDWVSSRVLDGGWPVIEVGRRPIPAPLAL